MSRESREALRKKRQKAGGPGKRKRLVFFLTLGIAAISIFLVWKRNTEIQKPNVYWIGEDHQYRAESLFYAKEHIIPTIPKGGTIGVYLEGNPDNIPATGKTEIWNGREVFILDEDPSQSPRRLDPRTNDMVMNKRKSETGLLYETSDEIIMDIGWRLQSSVSVEKPYEYTIPENIMGIIRSSLTKEELENHIHVHQVFRRWEKHVVERMQGYDHVIIITGGGHIYIPRELAGGMDNIKHMQVINDPASSLMKMYFIAALIEQLR